MRKWLWAVLLVTLALAVAACGDADLFECFERWECFEANDDARNLELEYVPCIVSRRHAGVQPDGHTQRNKLAHNRRLRVESAA